MDELMERFDYSLSRNELKKQIATAGEQNYQTEDSESLSRSLKLMAQLIQKSVVGNPRHKNTENDLYLKLLSKAGTTK